MSGNYKLLLGDVRECLRQLPDRSVQTVVTSPPYWGLRDYGVPGQIGLEPTMEEHFDNLSAVFAEVRRVLRDDGTAWVNYGDAYAQGGNCKPKDLLMLPARLAIRLQEDGWWLRSEIVWHKPNPMPESCTDRPTCAHEKVFLLAKSARYYYDPKAVMQPAKTTKYSEFSAYKPNTKKAQLGRLRHTRYEIPDPANGRNLRNVWTISAEPFPGAHFATYPQALVRPCILAGTSERGACPECGAPWMREVEVVRQPGNYHLTGKGLDRQAAGANSCGSYGQVGPPMRRTAGWIPGCDHGLEPRPCVVLDPFNGSGTTGIVALNLGRDYVGCELNPEYASMAEQRLQRAAKGLGKRESLDQGILFQVERDLFEEDN